MTEQTADPTTTGTDELVEMLRVHEARWTTHGYERPYDVMHCLGDCDARRNDDGIHRPFSRFG